MEMSNSAVTESSFLVSIWGSLKNALVGCGVAVLFGLVILLTSIYSVSAAAASDKVMMPIKAAPVTEVKVDYYLPYPGLLPDSPAYKFKMARDFLKLNLTFGEIQKAQVELLFADKRIGAAQVLLDGGKMQLAASTASKAEKYLGSSVNRTASLAKKGQDVKSMLLTLSKAIAKHTEIVTDMISKTSGEDRVVLETSLKNTKSFAEIVSQAQKEK